MKDEVPFVAMELTVFMVKTVDVHGIRFGMSKQIGDTDPAEDLPARHYLSCRELFDRIADSRKPRPSPLGRLDLTELGYRNLEC